MSEPVIADRWRSLSPRLLSLLRIVAAFLFIQSGTTKLFAFPAAVMPGGGTAPVGTMGWLAGVLEVVLGPLLLAGLFTRPVAFLLSGMMAVAYWGYHAPAGFWPVLNQGMPAVLFCFVFLFLSAAGGGPWSLDAARERRRA